MNQLTCDSCGKDIRDGEYRLIDNGERLCLDCFRSPESKVCVICRKYYEEEGHDAKPIREGTCCDYCYMTVGKLAQQGKDAR